MSQDMIDLVYNSPEFDKDYTLYRFIENDDYLRDLKVGDIFSDLGFTSTTRNPFYNSDIYKFGFILIKIKIPKNVKGVGLCIESYSQFPEEEEIILPPYTKLRLIKRDKNITYYHTDINFWSKINTRYEFEYVMSKNKKFDIPNNIIKPEIIYLDLLKDVNIPYDYHINDKIKYFINNYTNDVSQFTTKIGKIDYTILCEWYNSTRVYNNFYSVSLPNGFSIYTIDSNNVPFMIEIGEIDNEIYMNVNYHTRYSFITKDIDENDFLLFISKIANIFGIKNVVIYVDYVGCNINKINKDDEEVGYSYMYGGYCLDYYEYLKNKKRRFNNKNIRVDSIEIKPAFNYKDLDKLYEISPSDGGILDRTDSDDLYQIYKKTYLIDKSNKNNLADFYIWICENYCIHASTLKEKFNKLYRLGYDNPFQKDYYIFDSYAYLYNNSLINMTNLYEPVDNAIKVKLNQNKYMKNRYRLVTGS